MLKRSSEQYYPMPVLLCKTCSILNPWIRVVATDYFRESYAWGNTFPLHCWETIFRKNDILEQDSRLLLQRGKPEWPSRHLSHLLPTTLARQRHCPPNFSQNTDLEPRRLHLHCKGWRLKPIVNVKTPSRHILPAWPGSMWKWSLPQLWINCCTRSIDWSSRRRVE